MVFEDPHLKEVFPDPPLVAYKRNRNIRDLLIQAKVPPPFKPYPKRRTNGMRKCYKCSTCPYILEGNKVKLKNRFWNITHNVDCSSENIIYLIECNIERCKARYIGETDRTLRERIYEHKSYINNKMKNKATGYHFNLPGHSIDNLTITILEQVKKNDTLYRRERERFYIRTFNTYYNGMNRKP